MMSIQINNVPQSAAHSKYIVARAVDGDVWFYGAWRYDQEESARTQAREINGFVVENTAWLQGIFQS